MPICLMIYLGIMTAVFAPDWIASGRATQLYIMVAFEIVIIIALTIFLRKRENL